MINFIKKLFSPSHLKEYDTLQKNIGYCFKNKSLLVTALTHKSHANENRLDYAAHNERLEFLGDAVLELVVTDMLMRLFPDSTEGDLSKLRASVVNETSLAEMARGINLGHFMILGRGEDQCKGRLKDSILSDAFEALLGAIYMDSNFDKVYPVVKNRFVAILTQAQTQDINRDYKTKLQEVSQDKFKSVPIYKLVGQKGPDHEKIFEVEIAILNEIYGRGEGKSKKSAEQSAAKEALSRLGVM